MEPYSFPLLLLALIIVAGLSFYAGALLYQLKRQRLAQNHKREERIARIVESIQTIAKAMEQQQCNLSEGCIRLFHLLENIPVKNKPAYQEHYPAVYRLFNRVKDLPTHEQRQQISKAERSKQDLRREEDEAKLATQILADLVKLKHFNAE